MPRPNARVKSVHVTNDTDNKMLQAIAKRNFSKYVKDLIQAGHKKERATKTRSTWRNQIFTQGALNR
jgi:hypothetical protein